MQIVSCVAATTKPFAPIDAHGVHPSGQGQSSETLNPTPKESLKAEAYMNEFAKYKRVGKIGSTPPSCKHKCYGCIPCEAIQTRTTSSHSHSHREVQYANYEPEGWKCKCGQSFYNP
ncbi:EPIDERMAL PATTERNING FACTOR-like protein [Trema orientale]|uniref:Epidermal patterning factor-like protein n=1 Tax=Trema orientale TaxID=63057 RepID=A0A2P5FEE4_TREOI|nr:EPIDERMAL PATTERNING FACTOR-like protein [Trema orientale]